MRLSKKSWHYNLNMWYVNDPYRIPSNLCPYFWRTAWYTVILLPILLLLIPWGLFCLISGERKSWRGFIDEFPSGFIFHVAIFLLISMVAMWWHIPKNKEEWHFLFGLGCVGFTILVCVGGPVLIGELVSRINNAYKEKGKSTLIGGFITAKKRKLCPKIDWTE